MLQFAATALPVCQRYNWVYSPIGTDELQVVQIERLPTEHNVSGHLEICSLAYGADVLSH